MEEGGEVGSSGYRRGCITVTGGRWRDLSNPTRLCGGSPDSGGDGVRGGSDG